MHVHAHIHAHKHSHIHVQNTHAHTHASTHARAHTHAHTCAQQANHNNANLEFPYACRGCRRAYNATDKRNDARNFSSEIGAVIDDLQMRMSLCEEKMKKSKYCCVLIYVHMRKSVSCIWVSVCACMCLCLTRYDNHTCTPTRWIVN